MQLNYKIINWVLHFSWNNCVTAHHYRVMAMSRTFVYYSIGKTSDLYYDLDLDKGSLYVRFKVIAESINDIILYESSEVDISCSDIEKFKITALNGFNGTTLAFRSQWVYDLYKIYDNNTLIAETEDPILELLHKITKNKLSKINVEWYKKINDVYMLWWVSDGVENLPVRKKSDYKISVIIPVYNIQILLPRTIDSILSSSMWDIELILVNDGSEDDSLNICKWYVKKFPCVSVISQKNYGVAIARNNWMKIAKGKYVWFVDSDDIVHPFMYENLYNVCEAEDVDISIAVTIVHNDIGNREIILGMPTKKENIVLYTYDEVINNMGRSDNMYFVSPCNKIVKKDVAKQLKFPANYPGDIILYEDSAYTPALYSYIDKFALCKNAYYIWDKRQRKTLWTLSTRYKNEDVDNVWKAFIYASFYSIYNSSGKHKDLCDYTCFKHIIESYDKFKTPSLLLDYWNEELKKLINDQKLFENNLIMRDDHLKSIVDRFKN